MIIYCWQIHDDCGRYIDSGTESTAEQARIAALNCWAAHEVPGSTWEIEKITED